jgi:hypothetical protein
MFNNYLIHTKTVQLRKLFDNDKYTYWYDSPSFWKVISDDYPHSEEIKENTVVFCSSVETYATKKDFSAKYFVVTVPVDPNPGFTGYPVHNGIWIIQPTISAPITRFQKFPSFFDRVLCFNGSKLGPFLIVRIALNKFGPSDILLFMYNDLEKGSIFHKGQMEKRVLEDPRLFFHRGHIYSSFSVIENYITAVPTSCHLAYSPVINMNMTIPKYGKNLERGPEKNWGFFSSGEQLYAIYSYTPWRILKIDGEEVTAIYEQEFPEGAPKPIHGGTCPTFHDGKWWVFGRIMDQSDDRGSIVCVVFDPTTFRILAWAPVPFLSAAAFSYSLFYIGSAEIADGVWTCVGGFNDCSVAEVQFSHDALVGVLGSSVT